MKKLAIIVAMCLTLIFISGSNVLLAGNPPSDYYVDEAKLPFDALAGTNTKENAQKKMGRCFWVNL